MKFLKAIASNIIELCSALAALSFALQVVFFDGGGWASLLCGVWLIVAQLAFISKKLSKD